MNDNTSKKPTNDFDRVTDREKKQEWPPSKVSLKKVTKNVCIGVSVEETETINQTAKEKL